MPCSVIVYWSTCFKIDSRNGPLAVIILFALLAVRPATGFRANLLWHLAIL
jgi:hypothetical protein